MAGQLLQEGEEVFFPFDDAGCFGCSSRNPAGLRLRFWRRADQIVGDYTIPDRFHGAPGIAHGGIVAAVLDEFSCAAIYFLRGDRVVTGELSVRYERPCPVEIPLRIQSWIQAQDHPRYLVVKAEISDPAGSVLVRSVGKFFPTGGPRPTP
jgi:acyl-coenzyme A thioesterase PaaI-like protein